VKTHNEPKYLHDIQPHQCTLLPKLLVHTLEILQETLERKDTQTGIQASSRRPNGMHTQLRNSAINRPYASRRTQHGPNCASTPAVIANLKDLEFRVGLAHTDVAVYTTLQDSSGDSISRHMRIRVRRNCGTDVEARRVVFEVRVEEVGVHSVNHIARDEEGVCIRSAQSTARLSVDRELFDDALHDAGEEVAVGTLSEQRADFFVIEKGDHADLGRGREGRAGVEEGLDRRPGAELVIDSTGEDELSIEATSLGGLRVKELELPVDDGRVCYRLVSPIRV
jgi:hypothetical protein